MQLVYQSPGTRDSDIGTLASASKPPHNFTAAAMRHHLLPPFILIALIILAACSSSKRTSEPGIFVDPRDNRGYSIVNVKNMNWMQDPLQFNNAEVKSVTIGSIPGFYNKENANRACPAGWRLPTFSDLQQFLKWMPGDTTRFGKRLDSITLSKQLHFSLNGLGMGTTNPRAAGPGYMTGYWLSGDTTMQFFRDKPVESRSMGIHIYRAGADSFNIEPTYLENSRVYLLHCLCVRER